MSLIIIKHATLPVTAGQRVATHPNATAAQAGVRRITGAPRGLQDTIHTHQEERTESPGAKPTSASAAAPVAAAARPHAQPPETKAPARSNPPTADRTCPGEASRLSSAFVHPAVMWRWFVGHTERGTALTAQTLTAEHAAAHAATHPYEREEETHPASWRLAGSPGTLLSPSRIRKLLLFSWLCIFQVKW